MITDAFQPVLDSIDAWYSQHVPAIHATLRPGVSDANLDVLEYRTGLKLPESFRTLYRWHDGQDGRVGGVFGLSFLSLAEVRSRWEGWQNLIFNEPDLDTELPSESFPPDFIQDAHATAGWLGFLHDGGGNFVGLDFNPGPGGAAGQVITFGRDEESKYVLAASLGDFLREYAGRLSAGRVSAVTPEGYSSERWEVQLHDSQGHHTEGWHVLADLFPGFGAAPDDRDPGQR
jgi:cell wall assembly regulator SMI1